jgi:hypothetical protein
MTKRRQEYKGHGTISCNLSLGSTGNQCSFLACIQRVNGIRAEREKKVLMRLTASEEAEVPDMIDEHWRMC